MTRKSITAGAYVAAAVLSIAVAPRSLGQAAPVATPASEPAAAEEEVVVLSPFEVTASDSNSGYSVKDTLAGTRVRTELRDVASAISVVSAQLLQDTGATNNESLLKYTTSTEVGGVRGNFSGMGGTATYNESGNLLRPSNNTRVRGLDAADNTRDYFLTEIPWDGYNVGRVDLQRGPNSILFGVGSPAGIINASLNGATFTNENKFENRIDKYGSLRNVLDINYVLLNDQLALRVAGLDDKSKYQQKPAFNHDRRLYAALRYDPNIFGEGNRTSIRVNYENGDVNANRPRSLPPVDAITPWFKTGSENGVANLNKLTVDPTNSWDQWANDWPNGTATSGYTKMYPWFNEAFYGRIMGSNVALFYNGTTTDPVMMQAIPNVAFGIGSNGTVDTTISGIPFQRPYGITSYSKYAQAAGVAGGSYFYNYSLSDRSIFDFYNKLMDGDNKREWQQWRSANAALSQTFLNDRLGFELVYDYQRYYDGQVSFLGGDQFQVSVDINTKLLDGSPNPNVGRPFVGNSGQYGNTSSRISRDSVRFTTTGEIRGEDFFGKGLLAKILGRHVFTGLMSQDTKKQDNRSWSRWASESAFAVNTGQNEEIINGPRQIDWIYYLGPSLLGASSASGANLSNVAQTIGPASSLNVRYFNSQWNAPSVDPAAPYTYYDTSADHPAITSTQSENPANYVGWTSTSVNVLNADEGDRGLLYADGQRSKNVIKSQGITWQGYFLDGNLVPVFGWRKDKVSNASSTAPKGFQGVSLMDYSVDTSADNTKTVTGESKSWGAVLHMPRQWRAKLPLNTGFSVFYNRSENFKADAPRADIATNTIPNPMGETKDYGFVITTLNDKLSLKVNWYETKMANATLPYSDAGFSGTLYYVWAIPYWEATHALASYDGVNGTDPGAADATWLYSGVGNRGDAAFDKAAVEAAARDFFMNMPLPQEFFDNYGLNMNVAKMHSSNPADWHAAVSKYGTIWNPGLALQPDYNGRIRSVGAGPTASVDTLSKGVEFELSAQPTKNWNITANVAKTEASISAISPTIGEYIATYTEFLAGPAGELRLWGGDTFRTQWQRNVLSKYEVLVNQVGQMSPEVSKWRFNLISTYSFDEGVLKGSYVGGAYRWEDKRILGYQYSATMGTLDIANPHYGPTSEHFDFWVGYSRKLSDKINWRVQLNLRNVLEKTKLVPVNIQPDGSIALSRIQEGMTWQLTNTFSF